MKKIELRDSDALIIVDCQNDFMPGIGSLPVPQGEEIIPELNKWIKEFSRRGLVIVATRDWHPREHASFKAVGGAWPEHCVQGSFGAKFPEGLRLPTNVIVISKGTDPQKDAYSGFDGTDLDKILKLKGIKRLFVGGLATDYCVRATVLDALKLDFQVYVILNAIRGVDVRPGDSRRALAEMENRGATLL